MQVHFVNVLGVRVNAINMNLTLDMIGNWISNGIRNYVCVRDVHGVVRCQESETLRRIHNQAGLVTPDGVPLVWLARLAGFRNVERVCGRDLMLALCERSAATGYRHFLYGAAPGIAQRLAANLQRRFPGLRIVGTYSPPFRPLTALEEDDITSIINTARADVVWVGLSTPKQEEWMARYVSRLNGVLIGVGAAFDFHAGAVKQAPRWMQRSGFEWLFRVLMEPRRLWRRYGIVIPLFLLHTFNQVVGLRKYPLEK